MSDGSSVGDVVAAINQSYSDGTLKFIAATMATETETGRFVGGEAPTNHILGPQLLLLLDLADMARDPELQS